MTNGHVARNPDVQWQPNSKRQLETPSGARLHAASAFAWAERRGAPSSLPDCPTLRTCMSHYTEAGNDTVVFQRAKSHRSSPASVSALTSCIFPHCTTYSTTTCTYSVRIAHSHTTLAFRAAMRAGRTLTRQASSIRLASPSRALHTRPQHVRCTLILVPRISACVSPSTSQTPP